MKGHYLRGVQEACRDGVLSCAESSPPEKVLTWLPGTSSTGKALPVESSREAEARLVVVAFVPAAGNVADGRE